MANYLFPSLADADRLSGVRRNAARPGWETAIEPWLPVPRRSSLQSLPGVTDLS